MSRLLLAALVAAFTFAAPTDASAKKKKNVWGTFCSEAEDKKSCCFDLRNDCILDCDGYTGDAMSLCLKKCDAKHKRCNGAASAQAPRGGGAIDEPRGGSAKPWQTKPKNGPLKSR